MADTPDEREMLGALAQILKTRGLSPSEDEEGDDEAAEPLKVRLERCEREVNGEPPA